MNATPDMYISGDVYNHFLIYGNSGFCRNTMTVLLCELQRLKNEPVLLAIEAEHKIEKLEHAIGKALANNTIAPRPIAPSKAVYMTFIRTADYDEV